MYKLLTIKLLLLFFALTTPAFAAVCSLDIEGNDAMQFNLKEMSLSKSCKEFTVNLKHTGKLANNIMGHNWVLSKTADVMAISTDGMTAGLASDYLKASDSRVIAHTKVIGGGESTSVTFPVSILSATESYTFFCSFPGHFSIMKGSLKLVD